MYSIVAVLAALFLVTWFYAAVLNLPQVQNWYVPRHTWVTVVIGNALIGFAVLALCLLGELPLQAFWLLLAANVAAGIPIIIWQLRQNAQRRRLLYTNSHKG